MKFYNIIFAAIFIAGCLSPDKTDPVSEPEDTGPSRKHSYNFRLVISNPGVTNPADDKRVYYRVFLNKAEEGRTTTGLDSQDMFYEGVLQKNRHLVHIEKWVLDARSEKYIKLNNIDQPKPNYAYFTIENDKLTTVRFIINKNNAVIEIDNRDN